MYMASGQNMLYVTGALVLSMYTEKLVKMHRQVKCATPRRGGAEPQTCCAMPSELLPALKATNWDLKKMSPQI